MMDCVVENQRPDHLITGSLDQDVSLGQQFPGVCKALVLELVESAASLLDVLVSGGTCCFLSGSHTPSKGPEVRFSHGGRGFKVRVRTFKLSPAGTPENSPGRQSWVGFEKGMSPVGTTENHPRTRRRSAVEIRIVSVTVLKRQHGESGRGVVHEMPDIRLGITLLVQRPRGPFSLVLTLILRQPDQASLRLARAHAGLLQGQDRQACGQPVGLRFLGCIVSSLPGTQIADTPDTVRSLLGSHGRHHGTTLLPL